MGYYSDVAFSFTKENWKKLLEAINQQSEKFQHEAKWLLKDADINKDHPDGKHHVVYWNYIKWYENDPDSIGVIKFLEHKGRELANEYMRVGEEAGDFNWDDAADDESFFMRDGDGINIEGLTLSDFQKRLMLEEIVKAFMTAAPGTAKAWYDEHKEVYDCDEYEHLFRQ